MSTCKITYNGNEISAVDEAAPVSVAYNNATVATLNDGDTKTLGCHGKVMVSDVVIGNKTLNCNGKLMQGDIVVELVGSTPSVKTWYFNETIGLVGSRALIANFTSNGKEYTRIREIKRGSFSHQLQYENANTGETSVAYNYKKSKWSLRSYRTIVLDEPATGNLLAFLEANATKIS